MSVHRNLRNAFEAGNKLKETLRARLNFSDDAAQEIVDEVNSIGESLGLIMGHIGGVLELLDRIVRSDTPSGISYSGLDGKARSHVLFRDLTEYFDDPEDISESQYDMHLGHLVEVLEQRILPRILR